MACSHKVLTDREAKAEGSGGCCVTGSVVLATTFSGANLEPATINNLGGVMGLSEILEWWEEQHYLIVALDGSITSKGHDENSPVDNCPFCHPDLDIDGE